MNLVSSWIFKGMKQVFASCLFFILILCFSINLLQFCDLHLQAVFQILILLYDVETCFYFLHWQKNSHEPHRYFSHYFFNSAR